MASIHCLRRLFSECFHSGRMHTKFNQESSVGEEGTAGDKRKRNDADIEKEIVGRLQYQFSEFMEMLVFILSLKRAAGRLIVTKGEEDTEDEDESGDPLIDIQILAMSTIIHFFSHSRSVAHQSAQAVPEIASELVAWFLRHMLCSGASNSGGFDIPNEKSLPVWQKECLYRDFTNVLLTFRAEFVDDYSDIRYATLIALREVTNEKYDQMQEEQKTHRLLSDKKSLSDSAKRRLKKKGLLPTSSVAEGTDKSEVGSDLKYPTNSGFVHLYRSRELLKSCPPSLIGYNASNLMLSVNLAQKQEEWDEEEHDLYGVEQWEEILEELCDKDEAVRKLRERFTPFSKLGFAVKEEEEKPISNAKFLKDFDSDAESDDEEDKRIARLGEESEEKKDPARIPACLRFQNNKILFSDAWVSLLRLPLPNANLKRVLAALPTRVIPFMSANSPTKLADSLTDILNRGGVYALLSLESIFTLQQQHGIEYPKFYARLYTLLTPEAVAAKFRYRFFTMLDLFLSSAVLPSYLVAAFAKRAARLALTAPSTTSLFVLPFLYNLVKRHPVVQTMLHRAEGETIPSGNWPRNPDPFDMHEEDPSKCNALYSSLWEINALAQHVHAPVAHLARAISGPITKNEYEIAKYSESSFSDLIMNELNRQVKKQGEMVDVEVPYAYQQMPNLFMKTVETNPAKEREDPLYQDDTFLSVVGM